MLPPFGAEAVQAPCSLSTASGTVAVHAAKFGATGDAGYTFRRVMAEIGQPDAVVVPATVRLGGAVDDAATG